MDKIILSQDKKVYKKDNMVLRPLKKWSENE